MAATTVARTLDLSVSGDDGAVGLASYLAGLEGERAPAPVQLNAVDVEHFGFLSSVFRKAESHEQDGETLRARNGALEPASGDPAMAFNSSIG